MSCLRSIVRAKADKERYDKQMAAYQAPEKITNRKRNKTGYNMFFSSHVVQLKNTEHGVPSERGSVARLVGSAWKQLSADERQYYEREAHKHNGLNPAKETEEDEDEEEPPKRIPVPMEHHYHPVPVPVHPEMHMHQMHQPPPYLTHHVPPPGHDPRQPPMPPHGTLLSDLLSRRLVSLLFTDSREFVVSFAKGITCMARHLRLLIHMTTVE
jgi:HMG-box domain